MNFNRISPESLTRYLIAGASAAFIATASIAATDANAAPYSHFSVGNWKGSIHVDNNNGAFTHCVAHVTYNSGIKLLFSVDRDQRWGVGFSKETWNLTKGNEYPVRFQIDRGEIWNASAKAVLPQMARISLPGNARLFQRMRRGNVLKIAAGNDLLKFRLTSTNRLLKELLRCSVRNQGLVANVNSGDDGSSTTNPFGAQPVSATSTSSSEPVIDRASWRKEVYARAEAIMAKTGATFNYITPEDSPGLYKKFDGVWSMGKFIGSMRVVPFADAEAIDAAVAKDEEGKCDGEFQTRTKPAQIAGFDVGMRSAYCVKADGSYWSAFYTIYPRDDGSHYLMTIFTTKEELANTLMVGEHLSKIAVSQVAGL